MINKEKNILNRLLVQSKVCYLNWILFNIFILIISNPVIKINNFKMEEDNENL